MGNSINSVIKNMGFGWDTKMLVSSANKIVADVLFINLGKSFINIRKNKGPKTKS